MVTLTIVLMFLGVGALTLSHYVEDKRFFAFLVITGGVGMFALWHFWQILHYSRGELSFDFPLGALISWLYIIYAIWRTFKFVDGVLDGGD